MKEKYECKILYLYFKQCYTFSNPISHRKADQHGAHKTNHRPIEITDIKINQHPHYPADEEDEQEGDEEY